LLSYAAAVIFEELAGPRFDPAQGLNQEDKAVRKGKGAVAGLVGIECGVVSGVINLESSGVEASDWRPRHDEHYHEA
jgi:hypothetical protein